DGADQQRPHANAALDEIVLKPFHRSFRLRGASGIDLEQRVALLRAKLAYLLAVVARHLVPAADVDEFGLAELAFFRRLVTTGVKITTTWRVQRRRNVAFEDDPRLLGLRIRDRHG